MATRIRRRRMRDEEWDDLREDIDEILSDVDKPKPKPKPVRKAQQETTPGYLIALVFLAVLLACAIYLTWMKRPTVERESSPVQVNNEWVPSEDSVRNEVDDVSAALAELEEDYAEMNRRVSLLGSVVNNNFYVIRNGKDPNTMVGVKRDWRLDKMPPYLTITNKEEYRNRYVD